MGGVPYLAPTVGIEVSSREVITAEVMRYLDLPKVDIALFMTGPGTQAILSASKELGVEQVLLENLRSLPNIIARSTKPKVVLAKYGIVDNVELPEEATFDGIANLLRDWNLQGKNVAIFWHGDRSDFLVNALKDSGAVVLEFSTYSYSHYLDNQGTKLLETVGFQKIIPPIEKTITNLVRDLIDVKIDAITFTSPPSVSNLFETARSMYRETDLIRSLQKQVIVVSIGPSTSKRLEENGVKSDVIPKIYKMGKMVESLSIFVKKQSSGKKHNGKFAN